jgi:hypothetical protein
MEFCMVALYHFVGPSFPAYLNNAKTFSPTANDEDCNQEIYYLNAMIL